jgi:hypothetical protein
MNIIKYNNKNYFQILNVSNFLNLIKNKNNLLFKDICGEIQRNIDVNHLNNLIQYQKDYYKKYNTFSFPNQIILCEFNKKYAILDGQHRIQCIDTIYNEYKLDFNIALSIIEIQDISEYNELFISINKNKPLVLFNNMDDWISIGKHIETYFMNNFNIYNKSSEKPHVPHINFNNMLKYINENDIIKKSKITDKNIFINEIIELNNYYGGSNGTTQLKKYIKNYDNLFYKCKEKHPDNPLFLSIYQNYEWIDRIVFKLTKNISYHDMEHISIKNNRVKIKKPLRNKVWKSYNNSSLDGNCYVCDRATEYDTFECGHIISVFYGGKTDFNNLKPICSICNKDMGITNLEEYKKSLLKELSDSDL